MSSTEAVLRAADVIFAGMNDEREAASSSCVPLSYSKGTPHRFDHTMKLASRGTKRPDSHASNVEAVTPNWPGI